MPSWGMKLTTQLYPVQRLRMVHLYLHSHIHLHGVMLNYLGTGITVHLCTCIKSINHSCVIYFCCFIQSQMLSL
jgi:hypothetical protein